MKALPLVLLLAGAGIGGLFLGDLAAPVFGHAHAATTAPAAPAAVLAVGPSLTVSPSAPPSFRTVKWEDLTPKDWDPLKQFRGMNFDAMSDADPKAIAMLERMRATWDNAPTNNAMDEQQVRIAGYLVPLDESKAGLTRFLLVPYFGACIHTPPPPSNQIIDVTPQNPARFRVMEPVWVSGTLRTLRSDTSMGASSYRMQAKNVEAYMPGIDKGLGGTSAQSRG